MISLCYTARSSKEALIQISNQKNAQVLAGDLIQLLINQAGHIQERSFPKDSVVRIAHALKEIGIDQSIKIIFAGSVNPEGLNGDLIIQADHISHDISVRLQLTAIAENHDAERALKAFVALLSREESIYLSKFPAEVFYALHAVIQSSPFSTLITSGFAYTIKDELQPYGTVYFSWDRSKLERAVELPGSHQNRQALR